MYRVDYGNSFQVSPTFDTYREAERHIEQQQGPGNYRIQKYVGNGEWAWMREGRVTRIVL